MPTETKPFLWIVLDGWGERPPAPDNAITSAKTPVWDQLIAQNPHLNLSASGLDVGLPEGQMGNSEVGHMNMSAGRIVYQDLTRIDHAIKTNEFNENPVFHDLFTALKKTGRALHMMGLLSPGGVHSHEQHFYAFLELAARFKIEKVYIHAFLDGRDTPPKSAIASIERLEAKLHTLSSGKIVSLSGRYYAMDRDKRWERTERAFRLITEGHADYYAESAKAGLEMAYARGESDEFVLPTAIHAHDQPPVHLEDGDAIVCMNFRADRMRQLTHAFTDPHFEYFSRKTLPTLSQVVSLTEYAADISTRIAFPPQSLNNTFGQVIAGYQRKQLRIAQPEMSASDLTTQLIAAIDSKEYDVIICNYANPDMVGHTGQMDATIKAIETIDACLGRIIAAIERVQGELIVTSDHGNAEHMFDPNTGQAHTAHTTEPVPFVYKGRPAHVVGSLKNGILSDIAPTVLYLMGLNIPPEMTGQVLLRLDD